MAKPKRKKKRGQMMGGGLPERGRSQSGRPEVRAGAGRVTGTEMPTELGKKPLSVARGLSAVLLVIGVVMMVLGIGVATGRIVDVWGFPMSAVPNWGRPWGAVLTAAAAAYLVCPVLLFIRPQTGTVAMMIVCGLSVLVGTPLITTTTEILYNLLAQTDCRAPGPDGLPGWTQCRPDWVDSVWGYFMIVNVATLIAIYRALGGDERRTSAAPAD